MSWINLAKDTNKWLGLAITVSNLRVPLTFWIFLDRVRNYHRLKKEPTSWKDIYLVNHSN